MSYQSPPGFHRHQCPYCKTVWEHGSTYQTEHDYLHGHDCPNCGQVRWEKYTGPEPPTAPLRATKGRRTAAQSQGKRRVPGSARTE